MPAFILDGSNNPAFRRLSDFEQAYTEALFFADTPDGEQWSFDELHESALRQIKTDCAEFCADQTVLDLIDGNETQAGHDFWLTRQGHGAGFWDGDWAKDADTILTARAKSFRQCEPYKGDDGFIYF